MTALEYEPEFVPARDEDAPRDERWCNEWHVEHANLMRSGYDHDAEMARLRDRIDKDSVAAFACVQYRGEYLDWPTFWKRDRTESDWLLDEVLARGRGHAFYAKQKEGKSEFLLCATLRLLAESPNVVILYLDYEMGEDDIYDRLNEMGCGPDTDLDRLRYALLPTMAPLDTPDGGSELLNRVAVLENEFPDHHIVAVIDTTGRALEGDENSADTIRAFYRHCGIGLKQRGVTWARLDHAGKDAERGQRGSSAKGDDVDIVWRIVRTGSGTELRRDAARPSWVPERVAFERVTVPHLPYVRVADTWPAGTKEVAAILDDLGVAVDASVRAATTALRAAGQARRNEVNRAAVRWRKACSGMP